MNAHEFAAAVARDAEVGAWEPTDAELHRLFWSDTAYLARISDPSYVRVTSTPVDLGSAWVKKRFVRPDPPMERQPVTVEPVTHDDVPFILLNGSRDAIGRRR